MDENDDVVGRALVYDVGDTVNSADITLPRLDGDQAQCYYSVFVAEVCSHVNAHEPHFSRVVKAAELAEIAAASLARRLAIGREADNAENDACHGS